MCMYKCKCGVAHGNIYTPWHENKCPNCGDYPPVKSSNTENSNDTPLVAKFRDKAKPQCTCNIFLLMQSGCKCGFIEKERQDAAI